MASRQACLDTALARGDARAVEETARIEREAEQAAAEARDFAMVRELLVGAYPHEQLLGEMALRGHPWASALATLARCRITIE